MLSRGLSGSGDEYGDSVEPVDGHFVEGSLEVLDQIPLGVSVAHVLDQLLQRWVQKPTWAAKHSAVENDETATALQSAQNSIDRSTLIWDHAQAEGAQSSVERLCG